MRRCRVCGVDKPEDGYYRPGPRSSKRLDCKPCYSKKHAVRLRLRRLEDRRRLDAIKLSSGCVDCGYRAHPEALDFDHRPGTDKKFAISQSLCCPWSRLVEEVAKCDVRCANCHRVQTARRRRGEE